jgi:hypothetical protein
MDSISFAVSIASIASIRNRLRNSVIINPLLAKRLSLCQAISRYKMLQVNIEKSFCYLSVTVLSVKLMG